MLATGLPVSLSVLSVDTVSVVQGYGLVRELENAATEQDDKPTHTCIIKDCGQLASDAKLATPSQVCASHCMHCSPKRSKGQPPDTCLCIASCRGSTHC